MLCRFEAPSLTEALRQARAEVGPRAVVVDVQRAPGAWPSRVVLQVAAEPGREELERRLAARGFRRRRREWLLRGVDELAGPSGRAAHALRRLERLLGRSAAPGPLPRTLALVGPTGVGKTTTIAKLAGRARLEQRRRVGLVTLDLFRVAAVDQARAYADLLGAPLEVAGSSAELSRALDRLARCDLVLVDTAGRSPTDAPRLAELAALLAAAPEVEVWLTLSATTRLRELREAAARFAGCGPRGLVLTKLDETRAPGDAVELLARAPAPLRLVTDGQDVPEHIAAPDPARLAAWAFEGSDA